MKKCAALFLLMILWGSDVGHVPFLENKTDLENAIITFQKEFHF